MSECLWPMTFEEQNIAGDIHIRAEDISSYTHRPGMRERYTEAGWRKACELRIPAIEEERACGVYVDPALDFHDRGCVKRYGAVAEGGELCVCERRRLENNTRDVQT